MFDNSILYILVGSVIFYLIILCEKKFVNKEHNICYMTILRHSILVAIIMIVVNMLSHKTNINVDDTISMQDIFTEPPNF